MNGYLNLYCNRPQSIRIEAKLTRIAQDAFVVDN